MKFDYSILPQEWSCIVVDGDVGAGKTTLATEMAAVSQANRISLDDYLSGEKEIPYCAQIDYEALRAKILASQPKIIIEGICILKVLAKIGIKRDFHIFIKRYNGSLGWEFEQYLASNAKPPRDKLWREIVQYYKDTKSFEKPVCNLILSREVLSTDACQRFEIE